MSDDLLAVTFAAHSRLSGGLSMASPVLARSLHTLATSPAGSRAALLLPRSGHTLVAESAHPVMALSRGSMSETRIDTKCG